MLPAATLDAARDLLAVLEARGMTLATAESCTGGLIAAALTAIPGSSAVVTRGYVTYSNEAKMAALRVNEDVVGTFGAVSVATAWAMARGALMASGADVAVAITGIAGPGGGSPSKPVGTVVFARAERDEDPDHVVADSKQFDADGGRSGIRLEAALCALELLEPQAGAPTP